MASGLLMIENEREAQILKLAFEQCGVKVLVSEANYKNYTLSLQYMPDFLIMELPRICMEQMHIAGLLRKHQRFRALPIIGYGDATDESVKRGIMKNGVTLYLDRPLKFSGLLELLERMLKPYKKSLQIFKEENKEDIKDADYASILSHDTPPSAKLDLMAKYVTRLMAFPFTVAKVLQITNDEKTGAGQLSQAISIDPTISTNLLKVSNSVFFASANRRITSVKEAIVRVGFQETKKIVMGMMVLKMFAENTNNMGFNRIDFWYHSLAAALFSERIAKFMHNVNPEMAFLAGLLHDIGVIVLDEFFPQFFSAALKETSTKSGHFPDKETALFGINHNDLVAKLFPMWKMPDDVTGAIIRHCTFVDTRASVETLEKKLTLCVMMGNILAKSCHFGRECDQYAWPIENWVFEHAHIGNVINEKFIADISQSIDLFRKFLGLEARDYTADLKSPENATDIRVGMVNLAEHYFIPVELYLKRKGYKIDRINPQDLSVMENRKQFNIVIVWTGSGAVTKELLKPYSGFVKYTKAQKTEGPIAMAPLLCLTTPEFNGINDIPPDISIASNRFDLRDIEIMIQNIMSGTVMRMAALPASEPENPLPAAGGTGAALPPKPIPSAGPSRGAAAS